jgi:hypothetical protein
LGGGLVGVGGGLSWWVGVAGVEKKVKGVGHAWVGEWGLFFIKIKKSKNLTTVHVIIRGRGRYRQSLDTWTNRVQL